MHAQVCGSLSLSGLLCWVAEMSCPIQRSTRDKVVDSASSCSLPEQTYSMSLHPSMSAKQLVWLIFRLHLVGDANRKPSASVSWPALTMGTSCLGGACILPSTSSGRVSATCSGASACDQQDNLSGMLAEWTGVGMEHVHCCVRSITARCADACSN